MRISCGPSRGGSKTCKIGGRRVRLRDKASASTKAKRRSGASRLRKFRFTAADARACSGVSGKSARGKCMWRRVKARAE